LPASFWLEEAMRIVERNTSAVPDPAPEMHSHNATIVLTNNVVLDDQQPTTLSNVTFGHRYLMLGIHGTGEGFTLA